jgi:hypothetical protein
MVLGFGGGADINTLIVKKNYGKAIELLREQIIARKNDVRLRMQLADVLVLASRGKEAVPILLPIADEYARDGFAARAIAIFKKIEKIEPGRSDVEASLATLIKQSQPSAPRLSRPGSADETLEIGIEELGMASIMSSVPPAPPQARDFDADFFVPGESEESEKAEAPKPSPLVESALFAAFAQDELIEIIHGLQLLTFEGGDIIITEGESGGASLFVLTSGIAKAFVRNPQGKHQFVRAFREGDFFGEISILTGKPRTATVTAGTPCELLELDRATLDGIAKTKPNVWSVLKDFYALRANSQKEQRIRRGEKS